MALFKRLVGTNPKKPPTCTAVIVAAGLSQRCKGEDKLFFLISGKPVLAYTIESFQECKMVNEIIIVAREEKYEYISDMCQKYGFDKVEKIMKGGESRTGSVINGVFAASTKSRFIAIHDGARPCADAQLVNRTITAAVKYNAAAPATKITSTVKKVNASVISETVERDDLYEIQTPQVFRAEIIKAALTNVMKKSIPVTDDCKAVELLGVPIYVVEGSRRNIKITDAADLHRVESMILGGA